MTDIFDPTGQQLLEETTERLIPNAPAVRATPPAVPENAIVGELPDGSEPLDIADQDLVNQTTETQRLTQQALDATAEPTFRYQPLNAYTPPLSLESVANDELLVAPTPGVGANATQPSMLDQSLGNFASAAANRGPSAIGGTLVPTPSEQWQVDFDGVQRLAQDRANRVQAQAVAPIASPLVGVTRALNSGAPFGAASIETARQFVEGSLGISLQGIDSPLESTEPNTNFDQRTATGLSFSINPLLAGGARLADSILNTVTGRDFNIADRVGFTADDLGTARRIARDAVGVLGSRAGRRIDEVGPLQFLYENTITGLSERALRSRVNSIRRGQNPVRVFERPETFVGTGLNFYGDLSPTPNDSFIAELATNSADFRNLLRDLQPQLDAAGRARTNPLTGDFGDFGRAGSLSALLYLANIPEGLITGALYDIADLTRAGVSRTPAAGLLSRINPLWATPPSDEQIRRLDVLAPFLGRDTGFTQEWSEDNYLAFINNPALNWIPQGYGIQTAGGFVADLIAGGVADLGFDTIIRRASIRSAAQLGDAGTAVTRAGASQAVRQLELFPTTRQLELELNVPSVSPSRAETIVESPGQLNLFRQPESTQLELNFQVARPVGTQLELDLTVFPRQLEFDYTYGGSGTVERIARSMQQSDPLLASVRRSPQYERAQEFLSNVLGLTKRTMDDAGAAAEATARAARLDEVVRLASLTGVPNVVARQANDVLEPGVLVRLIALNAEDGVLVSNGRSSLRALTPSVDPIAPSAIGQAYVRLDNINRELADIDVLIDEANLRPRSVDDPGDAYATDLELTALQQRRDSFVAARDTLQQTINSFPTSNALNEVNQQLANLIDVSQSGVVVIDAAKVTPPNVGIVDVDDILPTSTRFTSDRLLRAYVAPLADRQQLTSSLRSDAQITALAKLWGDVPISPRVVNSTESQRALADIYRARYLSELNPSLYGRLGKSIPDIQPQTLLRAGKVNGNNIVFVPERLGDGYAIDLPDNATPAEIKKIVSDEVRNTAKYHDSLVEQLNSKLAKGQPTGNLPSLIEDAKSSVNRIFSEFPEIAERELIDSLPDTLRPVGAGSNALAPEYVVAHQSVLSSGNELQVLQKELYEVDDLVQQTQQYLGSLPALQRTDPADELATRRMSGIVDVPTATSERLKPVADLNIPNVAEVDALTPRQAARATARNAGFADERVAKATADVRSEDLIDGVEFEADPRAVTQITRRVDGMSYRELQQALRAYPDLSRRGNADELRDRLLAQRMKDYRRVTIDGDADVIDKVYRSIGVNIARQEAKPLVLYHGTKAANLDVPSTSLTNEYGIALYTDVSPDGAWPYAKAQPAEDLVDVDADFRTRFDDVPKLFEIEATDAFVLNTMKGDTNPLYFNVLDVNHPQAAQEYRELVQQLVKEYAPAMSSRFNSWSKSRHPRELLHYIRSQFLKDNQGQLPHYELMQRLQSALRERGIDAIKDDSIVAVLSKNWDSANVFDSDLATGTIEEAIRNRIAVDQQLASRIKNKTTEAIQAQDNLAAALYTQNNLRNSVADKEAQLLDEVTRLGKVEDSLDEAVRLDEVVNEQTLIDDLGRTVSREGNSIIKNNDLCL